VATIAFDTYKFIRTIKESDDTDLRHALQETEHRLDAKIDLLRSDMNLLRSDLNGKFTLLQWMQGLLLAGVASLVIKLFL
jgi:hypothetical protein